MRCHQNHQVPCGELHARRTPRKFPSLAVLSSFTYFIEDVLVYSVGCVRQEKCRNPLLPKLFCNFAGDQLVRGVDHRLLLWRGERGRRAQESHKNLGVGKSARSLSTVDELTNTSTLPTRHLARIAWWRAAGRGVQ